MKKYSQESRKKWLNRKIGCWWQEIDRHNHLSAEPDLKVTTYLIINACCENYVSAIGQT